MKKSRGMRRRDILRIGALGVSGAAAAALAGCGETQIVEREVVKVVTQEVPVEKVVTQIVEKERVIEKEVAVEVEKVVTQIVEKEKIVERIVTQEAPPQLKRVDLTLLYNQFGTPEMWRAVFKKLEQEKPHLVVRETAVPYPGTEQKVLTALAGGVDLDMASVIHQWLGTFGEKQAVVPLEPLMKRDGLDPERWYGSALLDATHRGTLIGLPYYFGPIMEFLNMDLFERGGLEHPGKLPKTEWNFDTYLEYAQKLTSGEGVDKMYGISGIPIANSFFLPMYIWAFGGDFWNDDLTKSKLDSPEWAAAVQWMADAIAKWKVAPSATESQAIPGGPWNAGRAAMNMSGKWAVGSYDKLDFAKSMSPFPVGVDNKRHTQNSGNSMGIFTNSKNQDEAWEVLRFLGTEGHKILLTFGFTNPTMPELRTWDGYLNNLFDWEDPNMYHEGSLEGEKFEYPPNANEISSLIAAALDEVVLGKKSAEVALSELQPKVDRILQEGIKS